MTTESNSFNITGLVIAVLLTALLSSILIWVVGMLGLGLEVDGFGPALIAGIAIALVGGMITWLMSLREIKIGSEIVRFIINAFMGAVVLLICARFIPGLTVDGFAGALLASIAIGAISWLLSLPLKRINRAAAHEQQDAEPRP